MENPVDHTLDLGFVNFIQHPENKNYVVFRFSDQARATSFEEALSNDNIWFEKADEEKRGKTYFMFGVHKNDFTRVQKINFAVEGKHKKPFIKYRILRITMYLFTAIVMTLAVIGYYKNKGNNTLIKKAESTQLKKK
jgi:hypothetical protein